MPRRRGTGAIEEDERVEGGGAFVKAVVDVAGTAAAVGAKVIEETTLGLAVVA